MKLGNYLFLSQLVLLLLGLASVCGVIFLCRKQSKRIWHYILGAALIMSLLGSATGLVATVYFKNLFGSDKAGIVAPNLVYQSLPADVAESLDNHRGKVVILNIWATWCGPCLKEMPELDRIQKTFQDENVVVLAISDEKKAEVQPFLEKHNYAISFGISTDTFYFREELVRPTTFIIDRKGVIREVYNGAVDYEELRRDITNYVE